MGVAWTGPAGVPGRALRELRRAFTRPTRDTRRPSFGGTADRLGVAGGAGRFEARRPGWPPASRDGADRRASQRSAIGSDPAGRELGDASGRVPSSHHV